MNPNRLNKSIPKQTLSKAVCIDLDATLARYEKWEGEKVFGKALDGAQQFTRAIKNRGLRIIILTSRCWPFAPDGTPRDAEANKQRVKEWLQANGIVFDEIHGKPIAAAYVDDRAVAVRKNPPPGEYARALAEIEQLTGTES